MGGPFWARKDARGWSIPKGEYLGRRGPAGGRAPRVRGGNRHTGTRRRLPRLGDFRQPSGKIITVFTAEADFQPERIVSNTFELEWPKGSGTISSFPEIDRAEWTTEPEARSRLVKGQLPILDALAQHLRNGRA